MTSVVIVAVVLIVLWFTVFNRMYYCGKLKVKEGKYDIKLPYVKNGQVIADGIIIIPKMNVTVNGAVIRIHDPDDSKRFIDYDIINKTVKNSDGEIDIYTSDEVYHNKSLNRIIFFKLNGVSTMGFDSSYFHC